MSKVWKNVIVTSVVIIFFVWLIYVLPLVTEMKYVNAATGRIEGETIFLGWSVGLSYYGNDSIEIPSLAVPETGRYILHHRITNLMGWNFKRTEHGLLSSELTERQDDLNRKWLGDYIKERDDVGVGVE